jgi:uncharacterized damage-inducible protein DinB
MKKISSLLNVFVAVAICSTVATAQGKGNKSSKVQLNPTKGFRVEFLNELNVVEKKMIDLANAMPQEKYSWRPGEGVRSVSEVYMHIATTNFMLPQFAGIKPPDGLDRNMEKTVTDKVKVLTILKQSFEHIRQAILQTSDAALNKSAKYFGDETTIRGVFFNAATHMHEHLGQSIAYARMNGVVPPWTAAEQAKQQGNKK